MFADLSLRTAGLDGESHSESFRRRSRLLREYANLVHSQSEWGTCNPVISSSLSSSTMTTTTTTSSLKSSSTAKTSTSVKTTSSTSTLPAISSLPSCGQTCFSNLIGQYPTLGCSSPDPSCLCSNVNFGYGIRDCSNGACGTDVASTVIAYETAYCSSALATRSSTTASSKSTTTSTSLCTGTPTGIALASPAPSRAVCNVQANGLALAGTGLLIAYTSGSPFVASVLACAGQCIATSTCTNFYFVAKASCNLHYGANSYVLNNSGVNAFSFYDISCFTGIALASPAPSGALCNVQANSLALTGTGLLIAYTSGSPYVTSVQACAAQCKATSTCTNFYFIAGSNCNLHYGANSYVLNNGGVNAFTLYDISCFTTCAIV